MNMFLRFYHTRPNNEQHTISPWPSPQLLVSSQGCQLQQQSTLRTNLLCHTMVQICNASSTDRKPSLNQFDLRAPSHNGTSSYEFKQLTSPLHTLLLGLHFYAHSKPHLVPGPFLAIPFTLPFMKRLLPAACFDRLIPTQQLTLNFHPNKLLFISFIAMRDDVFMFHPRL